MAVEDILFLQRSVRPNATQQKAQFMTALSITKAQLFMATAYWYYKMLCKGKVVWLAKRPC